MREDDSSSETSLELNLDPQQLASVRLDRPLLKIKADAQEKKNYSNCSWWGWNTHHQWGGGTVTVPLPERQKWYRNQPTYWGWWRPHHNPPNGMSRGTEPLLSERGRRIPQATSRWRRSFHHLVVMVMVMVIVMVVEGGDRPPPQGEMAVMMVMMMEMVGGDDSPTTV